MTVKNDTSYSGPLSPEEKAECDRELEEMRRENFRRFDKELDEHIRQHIRQRIKQRIDDEIFSVMD